MGAITAFPSLGCPLCLKSPQEKQANRTILPKLSYTAIILLLYTWIEISWALLKLLSDWVIKTTTFPCISFHFVVAKMTSRGSWGKGTETGAAGLQFPLLRVRSLTEERCERPRHYILQVRDELCVWVIFYFKGSTRHWRFTKIQDSLKISLILGEKAPKDQNEEPKVSPAAYRKCKEKPDFWKSEVVNLSSLISLWKEAGSFCSGERKTVSKIYLVFSVAKSHYCSHFVTSACHWPTRNKAFCSCWDTEEDRGEPRQTKKWSVIWSHLMLLSPSKPLLKMSGFPKLSKDKARAIKSN